MPTVESNTTPKMEVIEKEQQKGLLDNEQIDLKAVLHRIIEKRWKIAIVIILAIVISIAIIIPVPRYYRSSVELAPELGIPNTGGGSLSDIASSMGINLGEGVITDAISPELYPDLMKSNTFVMQLINCEVKSNDGKINTTYYQYLLKHQKYSPAEKFIGIIKKAFSPKKANTIVSRRINPFKLTKEQDGIFGTIKSNIKGSTDKKTNVITITVEDQDPLIAATMAENARKQLQVFITKYRTSKARNDVNYYTKLTKKAKADYEKIRQEYAAYSDANTDVTLPSVQSKLEDIENDMQLKFNAYTAVNSQLQSAEAKLQERTPAFTVLSSASVPIKPAGPKRMIFVLGMTFLAALVSIIYFCHDQIF